MKHKQLCKLLSTFSFAALGFYASLSLANPYGNPVQRNYNQGYGDFPPANIDQRLQGNYNEKTQPVRPPQDYRAGNPWSAGQNQPARPPTPNYPPQNYQAPNYGGSPYGGGPGGYGPWNSRGSSFSGPWNNRGSGFSPWGNRGGRDPFGDRGPGDWFDPSKGAMSRNWDDTLNAPSRMGDMPGGWTAPSVSMPNPIDVGDEFSNAAEDAPDQMDNFNWNNNRGRGYR